MQVGAVVVGFDRRINYYKIQYATLCIYENPGCLFIATNLDARTHLTDAQEWAGNGAMVGAIKGSVFTPHAQCFGDDSCVGGPDTLARRMSSWPVCSFRSCVGSKLSAYLRSLLSRDRRIIESVSCQSVTCGRHSSQLCRYTCRTLHTEHAWPPYSILLYSRPSTARTQVVTQLAEASLARQKLHPLAARSMAAAASPHTRTLCASPIS